jgi:hypothetical protein
MFKRAHGEHILSWMNMIHKVVKLILKKYLALSYIFYEMQISIAFSNVHQSSGSLHYSSPPMAHHRFFQISQRIISPRSLEF